MQNWTKLDLYYRLKLSMVKAVVAEVGGTVHVIHDGGMEAEAVERVREVVPVGIRMCFEDAQRLILERDALRMANDSALRAVRAWRLFAIFAVVVCLGLMAL